MDCCMQVCTNMHSIIPRGIYSPVCLHDNCKLTRAHFVFSFLSSRERILHSPRCERNQQLRNRRRRRKKEREQLRAAPLEMSFTACPAAKEPCIIEMESVRENATSPKQTLGSLDKVRVAVLLFVHARLDFLPPLFPSLKSGARAREEAELPSGPTSSHAPPKETCRAEKTDNYRVLLCTALTSEEH